MGRKMRVERIFHKIVGLNVALSRWVDARVWPDMSRDGNRSFVSSVKPLVGHDSSVADVGGGKSPFFSSEEVAAMNLHVTGLDVDQSELGRAPAGAYSRVVCEDITTYRGDQSADFVIVQSLLEHVSDNRKGMLGIASLCKPGGRVFTFCPNRRAWFAVLNRLLPEGLKRRILYTIYPHTKEKQGFPAFYDRCTPAELSQALGDAGLSVVKVVPYFVSSYFMFFFPLYLFWRLVTYPLMRFWPMAFCETFVIYAVKSEGR